MNESVFDRILSNASLLKIDPYADGLIEGAFMAETVYALVVQDILPHVQAEYQLQVHQRHWGCLHGQNRMYRTEGH